MSSGPAAPGPAAWIENGAGGDPDTDPVVILGYD